jgi:hypothetical protein
MEGGVEFSIEFEGVTSLLLIATLKRRMLAAVVDPAGYIYSSKLVHSLEATEGSVQLAADELNQEGGVVLVLSDIPQAAFCLGQGHKYSICVEKANTQAYRAREILEALYIDDEKLNVQSVRFERLQEVLFDIKGVHLQKACKKLEGEGSVKIRGAIGHPVLEVELTPRGTDLVEGTVKEFKVEHHHQGHNYSFSDLKNSAVAINSAGVSQSVSVSASFEERELGQVLEKLADISQRIERELPSEKVENFTSDFEIFVKEVSAKAPRAKWYNISGEGLMEAAHAVATLPAKVLKEYKECIDLASVLAKAKIL